MGIFCPMSLFGGVPGDRYVQGVLSTQGRVCTPWILWATVDKRAVRILLKWFLVVDVSSVV